ncbi:efflux RND transporter periplasmic adaptor subunit [Polymorphobacter sp.]|uniref:efflux RND transporter periplasmic adaptor subunit n=1 Tax=Polymorphobacter sp. TaxID=1909290 RepID=UPI003F6E85F1
MSYRFRVVYPALVFAGLALASCGSDQPQQAAPPPTMVETIVLQPETVPNIIELPGRIEAIRTAEVRARTNGIVEKRLYREGTDVKAGTPLFLIDPREYRAQREQAQAALQRALAARENAASVVARYKPLVADRAVSGQENDLALSTLRQAEAQVTEARAALAQSDLQLSFTTVRAPISGRVSRAEVTEGALVSGTEATLMTRVDQSSPAYAVFTQSSSAILDMMAEVRAGQLQIAELGTIKVRLILENGADYGLVGQLDFADQSVDPQTGSQTVRAVFANPNRVLVPGQFVRGRIEAGTLRGGFAIPERAVQFQANQASVSVVDADNEVSLRPVQLGAQVGGRWVVQSGLKAGERIITDGWQKVRPGQKVRIAGQVKAAPVPAGGR